MSKSDDLPKTRELDKPKGIRRVLDTQSDTWLLRHKYSKNKAWNRVLRSRPVSMLLASKIVPYLYKEFSARNAENICDELYQNIVELFEERFGSYSPKNDSKYISFYFLNGKKPENKSWYRYEFEAAIISLKRVTENIKVSRRKRYYYEVWKSYKILQLFCYDYLELVMSFDYHIAKNPTDFGLGRTKWSRVHSTWAVSKRSMYGAVDEKDASTIVPVSIFLLRQSLERHILSIFGISNVWSAGNRRGKSGYFKIVLDLYRKYEKQFETPVNANVIANVHNWSHTYVHTGYASDIWVNEWAFHAVDPIFGSGEHQGVHRRFGAVKIPKNIWSQIEVERDEAFREKGFDFSKLQRPECFII